MSEEDLTLNDLIKKARYQAGDLTAVNVPRRMLKSEIQNLQRHVLRDQREVHSKRSTAIADHAIDPATYGFGLATAKAEGTEQYFDHKIRIGDDSGIAAGDDVNVRLHRIDPVDDWLSNSHRVDVSIDSADHSHMLYGDEHQQESPQEREYRLKREADDNATREALEAEERAREALGKNLLTMSDPHANLLGVHQYRGGDE